ncbi:hypothetical protein R6Z07M_011853 [Ovis aries]
MAAGFTAAKHAVLWRSAMTLKAGHARDSSFILQDTHLPPPPDGSKNLGGELLEQADQTLVWEGGKEADAGVLGEEEGYVAALRPEATHVTCTENPKEGKEKAKNSALQLELRLGFVCDGTGLRKPRPLSPPLHNSFAQATWLFGPE